MELKEESLPVGFLDLVLCRFGFDAKGIVKLCFCYHLRRGWLGVLNTSNCRRNGSKVNWGEVLSDIGAQPESC